MIGVSFNLFLTLEPDIPPLWDCSVSVHRNGTVRWINSTPSCASLKPCLRQALEIARSEVASKQLEEVLK